MLYDLLTEVATVNITSGILEESRMRTATLMSKVFLHHLTPLSTLATFSDLWLDILDYIEKFMKVGSDMLHEAMLESLKNVLLVMHSVRSVCHFLNVNSQNNCRDFSFSRCAYSIPMMLQSIQHCGTLLGNGSVNFCPISRKNCLISNHVIKLEYKLNFCIYIRFSPFI